MPAGLVDQLTAIENSYTELRSKSSFDHTILKQLNDVNHSCLSLSSDTVFLNILNRVPLHLIEYVGGCLLKKWYYEKIDLDNEQLDFLKNVGLLNIKIALTLQIKPDVELVKILIFFGDNDDIFNILIDILNTINDIDEKFLENIRFIFDAISHFEHGHFNRKENVHILRNH
ncbi:unnamed protein product [Didymodactylos carnosus]|uniref:Uncharacterized protein n=1 Tax=Didymodactylos carnosus TaxID=1234261 RepID=A0A814J1M1_9BILA|nr:unnamed protein product [Didymodactylos carnosus]CAF3802769.1 unnamed protein product [Didymodactylos carnosus]